MNRLELLVDGVCVGTNETCTALAFENESHYHYLVKIFLSKLTDSSARTLITLLGYKEKSVNDLHLPVLNAGEFDEFSTITA